MLSAALFALALFAQEAPAPVAAAEPSVPAGAPEDDYGLTAWCAGSLSRWMELRPRVMEDVRRIEGRFTRPGSSIEQDMAAYDELHAAAEQDMALFTRALVAAEQASPRGLASRREGAFKKGQSVWTGADNLPSARLAQEWMSWALPGRCQIAANRLAEQAAVAAPALRGADSAPAG
jgi:hypothetical protein